MFGMAILNQMKMTGNNISVKLRTFEEKITNIQKLKFSIYDDSVLINQIEIDNVLGDDEYSSPFVMFDGLLTQRKYKIVIEYYKDIEWVYCCDCYASAITYNYQSGSAVYTNNLSLESELPISGAKIDVSELSKGKSMLVSCEVVR